jgi:hypothetical protein
MITTKSDLGGHIPILIVCQTKSYIHDEMLLP